MKPFLTVLIALYAGFGVYAHDARVKVERVPTGQSKIELSLPEVKGDKWVRLYRRPNSRIKKELYFQTKKDFSKLV